ncbi:MAG: hypothetical protein JNL67_06855 [Planctomycetaceae bacterium]|nr:hypothetical protein [Planctomycetaceae bacterium]
MHERFRLVYFILILWAGCSDLRTAGPPVDPMAAERQRLAGTWKVDFQVNDDLVNQLLDGDVERKQSPEEQAVRGMAEQFLGNKITDLKKKLEQKASQSMQLTFSADGTWSSKTAFSVARGEKSGTWKVLEKGSDFLEISCTWADAKSGQSETTDTRVSFLAPDRIRLVPPNMAGTDLELTFVKETAK